MKLVFTKQELAEALQMSVSRFDELRPGLEAVGFPRPVPGLGARWSIVKVNAWITQDDFPLQRGKTGAAPEQVSAGTGEGGSAGDALPSSVLTIQRHLERKYAGRP